jgi:tetratricopeptide (TPR) repeat protein
MFTNINLFGASNTRRGFLKLGLLCTVLGVCPGTAVTAIGQQAPPSLAKPSSHNVAQPTPQQQAIAAQIGALDQAAALALHADRYRETESDARQALALGQDSGVAQELLASALNAQDKEQEAFHIYQAMASSGGDQPRNLLPYALLLLKAGQWAPAVAAYNKALPKLANGDLVRDTSRFSASVPEPTSLASAIHIALGLIDEWEYDWSGHSQNEKALPEYQKALELAPDWDLANYYYGCGLRQRGMTQQASIAFEKTASMATGAVKLAAEKAMKK